MSFHADFWVVTGTAAPVIALSSILVLGDQLQLGIDIEITEGKAPRDIPLWEWPSEYYGMFTWYFVTSIIIFLQALVLAVSLQNLAQESNYWLSPTPVIIAEFSSLILLAVSTLRLIQQKDWAKQVARDKHSRSLRSKTLRHPSRKPQSDAFRRANRYRSSHQITNARSARRGPQPRKQFLGRRLMHSILWLSVGVSAGVAIITTVLIDFLFKPGLEARKERILEKKRDKRKAIKGFSQLHSLSEQLLLHKQQVPDKIPEEYLRKVTEQFDEKLDAVNDVLKIPDSVGRQWDKASGTITTFALVARIGETTEEAWEQFEYASDVMHSLYRYFKTPRWRLLRRRMIIKDIKSYPTYENTEEVVEDLASDSGRATSATGATVRINSLSAETADNYQGIRRQQSRLGSDDPRRLCLGKAIKL